MQVVKRVVMYHCKPCNFFSSALILMRSLCKESTTASVYWPKPKILSESCPFSAASRLVNRVIYKEPLAYIASRETAVCKQHSETYYKGGILHFALQLNRINLSAATIASLNEKEENRPYLSRAELLNI